jgi:tetratricopeptide (TPR) repeat protein
VNEKSNFFYVFCCLCLSIFSCASNSGPLSRTVAEAVPIQAPGRLNFIRGDSPLSAQILSLTENGDPDSLESALQLIQSNNLTETDWGREMNYVISSIITSVYPELAAAHKISLPASNPLKTHPYTKILTADKNFDWTAYKPEEGDYFALILPFIKTQTAAEAPVELLAQAAAMNPGGCLAWYLLGRGFEKAKNYEAARREYQFALKAQPGCYSAALGRHAATGSWAMARPRDS